MKLVDYVGCLSHKAFHSNNTRGRKYINDPDSEFNAINPFISDAGKILESKAMRRLRDKTQVYYFPNHVHVRTRLTHTLEVLSLSLRLASLLGLNQDLCQAISLGHDIGHTPNGHTGEEFISKVLNIKFRHEKFGPILLHHIERKGQGINLSWEVYQGILNHSRTWSDLTINPKLPLEYSVVLLADKINYVFSDINDLIRYRYLKKNDLPPEVFILGQNQRERILNCVKAIVEESVTKYYVSFTDSFTAKNFVKIKTWLYEHMYKKERHSIYEEALNISYEFLQKRYQNDILAAIALALMTDKELNALVHIKLESGIITSESIKNFGFMEIMPYILDKQINLKEFIW